MVTPLHLAEVVVGAGARLVGEPPYKRYWVEANWSMVLAGGWEQEGMEGMVALKTAALASMTLGVLMR